MADNFLIVDGSQALQSVRSTDLGANLHVPHHYVHQPSVLVSDQGVAGVSAAAIGAAAALSSGITVRCKVTSPEAIYVGPTGITASTGYELLPGNSLLIHVSDRATLFVVSSAGTGTYCYLGS